MIVRPLPIGALAVPQSAIALLAFQLADHWGNRSTPGPAPRAEVLAAVLLREDGWDGHQVPLRLGPDGEPLALDTWPAAEREAIWRAGIERAATCGRYVAWLVSHHITCLAERFAEHHGTFLAAEERRRTALAADLAGDPRYRQILATGADAVNRAIVRITDAVAAHLIRGCATTVTIPELPRRGGPVPLELLPLGADRVRLCPWPLAGHRLPASIDAWQLATTRFADQAALERAWRGAPRRRLTWTLLGPER